jgi:hypothetical protein
MAEGTCNPSAIFIYREFGNHQNLLSAQYFYLLSHEIS